MWSVVFCIDICLLRSRIIALLGHRCIIVLLLLILRIFRLVGFLIPIPGLRLVLGDTSAILITHCQITLSLRTAMTCRLPIPLCGYLIIFLYAISIKITIS